MLNSPNVSTTSTASPVNPQLHKLVVIPFGNCEVVVCLTQDDRFVSICELRIKRDFLSPEQRVANSGYLDVEKFYQE